MARIFAFNACKPREEAKLVELTEWEKIARNYPLFPLLRRLLAVSCCAVALLSFVIFILSMKLYIDRYELFSEREVYAEWESWKLIAPSFSSELSFCYFIIAASLLSWMVSVCGFLGATNCKISILLLYVVLWLLMISLLMAAIIYNTYGENKTLDIALDQAFGSFVENHYRSGNVDMIFNSIVDYVQERHHCCGYRKTLEKNESYPAYYTILYWLEMTEWGLLQAHQILLSGNSMIEYVPKSCCRDRTNASCNIGNFQNRLRWSNKSEKSWTDRIYVKSCNEFLNTASALQSTRNGQAKIIATIFALSGLGSILAAFYLYFVIKRCRRTTPFYLT